jgi:hypothetical protein
MTESATAPLRAEPFVAASKAKVRANDNLNASARNGWARMSRFGHYAARPLWTIAPMTFGAGLALAIAVGWINRDQDYLVPESGLGYWLGIAGAVLMLLLLIYPLRKRVAALRKFGSVAFWFRLHMVLGLVGPTLILFHANFSLGSLNSNVAMIAMLIVATSGIVGRYLYGKIHLGLYGRKAEVREILADMEIMKHALGDGLPVGDHIVEQLNAFSNQVLGARRGFFSPLGSLPMLGIRAGMLRRRLIRDVRRAITAEAKRFGWSRSTREQRISAIAKLVGLHLAAVKKVAAFAFYERLFGHWHMLHLPLFVMLILAASVHVVTAHLF